MVTIRNELRQNERGEPEVWANLGDILDWLGTLPSNANHPAAGSRLISRVNSFGGSSA